jgi:nitrogen fixation protein NifU and related proteins
MNSLYQERILDYYRNPRNRGVLDAPDFSSGMVNPSCGDAVSIQGKITGDTVEVCSFEGKGCVISQAAASMLCEQAIGKSIEDIHQMDAQFMQSLLGMQLGPTRLKCVLLSLEALKKGLYEYQN